MDPNAIKHVVTFKNIDGKKKFARDHGGKLIVFDTIGKARSWIWNHSGDNDAVMLEAKPLPYDPRKHL